MDEPLGPLSRGITRAADDTALSVISLVVTVVVAVVVVGFVYVAAMLALHRFFPAAR